MRVMKHGSVFVLAALAVIGCHSSHSAEEHHHHHAHEHEHEHEMVEEHEHHATGEIVFDEHRQELFGIETETVAPAPFKPVIKAGGRFSQSQGDDIVVVAPIAGVVHYNSSSLVPGSRVNGGKAFAIISTAELAGADPAVKVKSAYESARAEYLRDSVMVLENIVSVSHFEQSRANYLQAKSEYDAFYSAGSGNGLSVTPRQGGYLRSLEAASGQYVEAGSPIAVISRGNSLTLSVDVPEKYASQLAGITNANFTTPSGDVYSVKELGGKILSRSRVAEDGYFTVSFELADNGIPVSGSFSEVWLEGAAGRECISVPMEALIEEQGVFSVFVQLDEDCFRKQPVKLGSSNGVRTEIKEGLTPGETVVSKGAMHIKLASAVAVPSGHNHQH